MEMLPSDGLCNYTTPFESLYENSFLWTRQSHFSGAKSQKVTLIFHSVVNLKRPLILTAELVN